MCVICIKKRDVAIPSMEVLKNCFEANHDGAGYMYLQGSKVFIRKGFMTFESFQQALEETITTIGQDNLLASTMVFHFRIGTHGSKNDPRQTHPFPIVDSYEEMEKLEYVGEAGVAHNGILSVSGVMTSYRYYTSYTTHKDTTELNPSDTMEFTKKILVPLTKVPNWNDDLATCKLIEGLAVGSKLAILNKDYIQTFGHFEEKDGLLFSNLSWIPTTKVIPITSATKGYNKPHINTQQINSLTGWNTLTRPERKEVSRYLKEYKEAVAKREDELVKKFENDAYGYMRVRTGKYTTFYKPVDIFYKSYSDAQAALWGESLNPSTIISAYNPNEAYYITPGEVLYRLDTDRNLLQYVGYLVSFYYLNPREISEIIGTEEDYRWKAPEKVERKQEWINDAGFE